MDFRRITVNLEDRQATALQAEAEIRGLSVSALARAAVNAFLQNPAFFLGAIPSGSMKSAHREAEQAGAR